MTYEEAMAVVGDLEWADLTDSQKEAIGLLDKAARHWHEKAANTNRHIKAVEAVVAQQAEIMTQEKARPNYLEQLRDQMACAAIPAILEGMLRQDRDAVETDWPLPYEVADKVLKHR